MWFLKIIFSELFICRQILLSGVFWCSLVRPVVHMNCHTILKAEKSAQSWCLVLLFFLPVIFPGKWLDNQLHHPEVSVSLFQRPIFLFVWGQKWVFSSFTVLSLPSFQFLAFLHFFVILLIIWRSEQSCITDALSHSTCTENGDK